MDSSKENNIPFSDICKLLDYFQFKCSIRGDHYIYRRTDTPIINLQPAGNKAKAYQVRQIRRILKDNNLEVE